MCVCAHACTHVCIRFYSTPHPTTTFSVNEQLQPGVNMATSLHEGPMNQLGLLILAVEPSVDSKNAHCTSKTSDTAEALLRMGSPTAWGSRNSCIYPGLSMSMRTIYEDRFMELCQLKTLNQWIPHLFLYHQWP